MLVDPENDRLVTRDILTKIRYRLIYMARLEGVSDKDYELDCIGNSKLIEEDFDTLKEAQANAPSGYSYQVRRICCHLSEDIRNCIYWSVIREDPVVEV